MGENDVIEATVKYQSLNSIREVNFRTVSSRVVQGEVSF